MDKAEVQHWIMPDDYDHAIAESKHLIYEADEDKVGEDDHYHLTYRCTQRIGSPQQSLVCSTMCKYHKTLPSKVYFSATHFVRFKKCKFIETASTCVS